MNTLSPSSIKLQNDPPHQRASQLTAPDKSQQFVDPPGDADHLIAL